MISKEQVNAWILDPNRTPEELMTLLGVINGALDVMSDQGKIQEAFAAGVTDIDAAEKAKLGE